MQIGVHGGLLVGSSSMMGMGVDMLVVGVQSGIRVDVVRTVSMDTFSVVDVGMGQGVRMRVAMRVALRMRVTMVVSLFLAVFSGDSHLLDVSFLTRGVQALFGGGHADVLFSGAVSSWLPLDHQAFREDS